MSVPTIHAAIRRILRFGRIGLDGRLGEGDVGHRPSLTRRPEGCDGEASPGSSEVRY